MNIYGHNEHGTCLCMMTERDLQCKWLNWSVQQMCTCGTCVHQVHVYTRYMCTPSICVHQVHVCTTYMCTTGTFIFYILNSIFVHQVLVYTQYWNKCTDIIESTQTILTMYTCTLMISAALVSFLPFPWALQFYTDPKSRRPDGKYPGIGPWI